MPTIDLFHKRQKRLRGDVPEIYVYDQIPNTFRVQVVQIMHEILGEEYHCHGYDAWVSVHEAYSAIVSILRKELGVFRLPPAAHRREDNYVEELAEFLLHSSDHEVFLSGLEVICRAIETVCAEPNYRSVPNAVQRSKDAIIEINSRLREHGLGYEYNSEIIRIDTHFVHVEAVQPALKLLALKEYQGAQEEFLKAHEHYRKGNNKEAMAEALKAIESVLKSICQKRSWLHSPNDTSSKLIAICFDNGLIPQFWQSHFSALRSTLEASVPTARNKLGGHGQGAVPQAVPAHLVGYVLHMTASTIVFLVQAEQHLP